MEKIKVVLRIRPFTKSEKQKGIPKGWNVDQDVDKIEAVDKSLHHHPFTFDHIFTASNSNSDVYSNSCKDVIKNTMEGIDTTIFVYGQTGSGKTHTMLGPPNKYDFNGVIF